MDLLDHDPRLFEVEFFAHTVFLEDTVPQMEGGLLDRLDYHVFQSNQMALLGCALIRIQGLAMITPRLLEAGIILKLNIGVDDHFG